MKKIPKRGKLWLVISVVILCLATIIVFYKFHKESVGIDTVEVYSHPQKPLIRQKFPIDLSAKAYILVDVDTNTVLLAKNENVRIYPASITKLVTAMTALNIYPLSEKIKVSEYKIGKVMELVDGDELTVRDLVKAILIHSANDAAYNLANSHTRGIDGFIEEMNALVRKYGLLNSHFENYDGIHQANHYSTAYDLAQIGRMAIKNPTVVSAIGQEKDDVSGKLGLSYKLETTNEMLGKVNQIKGLKTGWTPEAGGCFVSYLDINGKKMISVVVDSEYRFEDTQKIIDWIYKSVEWVDYYSEI